MELTPEEHTLLAIFRSLGEPGKKELLQHASKQQKMGPAASESGLCLPSGQCRLKEGEDRPERVSEPIFTE